MNAPDFTEGYPSKGKRIGPAWQHIWDMLGARPWAGPGLVAATADRFGLERTTVANLLRSARRAGVLEVQYKIIERRKTAVYRRAR
jgi:hypothetical protein